MSFKWKSDKSNLFKPDGIVPVSMALLFGIQHILAMFVANITPVIIIAGAAMPKMDPQSISILIQNSMFVAGIATLLQIYSIWKIGARIPIVMGCSFTFVAVLCAIATKYGYATVMGAALAGGIFEGTLGLLIKKWGRLISPIVAATVVTTIGLSLFPVGVNSFCGGFGASDYASLTNIILGFISLIACILWLALAKGYAKLLTVLAGLIAGYIAALFCGSVNTSLFSEMKFLAFPQILPSSFEFQVGSIFSVCVIFLVSAAETVGDSSAMAYCALQRQITDKELSGSIACDGYASAFSSLFGCPPVTSFSQNVGLAAITKVVNRFTFTAGVAVLIIASMFPPLGVFFTSIPQAVLGGACLLMFGNIAIAGMRMIANCGFTFRNMTIVSLSLIMGLGFTSNPAVAIWNHAPQFIQDVFAHNEVALTFVIAVLLDKLMPEEQKLEIKIITLE